MFFAIFQTFFKWILGLFGAELIAPPTDDLNELARSQIGQLIKIIRSRNDKSEVDAKSFEVNVSVQGSVFVIPKSTDSFIEFYSDEIIQESPEIIFGGFFLNQKKVAIKKVGWDNIQLDKELAIADQLKHHENFLMHLFGFKQLNECFIATEFYDASLLSLFHNSSNFTCEINLKDLMKQLCNGLEFLHDSGIAHRCLHLRNIVMVMRGNQPIFKITNFRDALQTSNEKFIKSDIKDLANIFILLRGFQTSENDWKLSDDVLLLDIVDEMTSEDHHHRPSMSQITAHPFLKSPHEILHFIVQLAKLLESMNKFLFHDALEKVSSKIFTHDWRSFIDHYVCSELREINFGKYPAPHVTGLVKTIRNLVRSFLIINRLNYQISLQTVHHRTRVIEKAMGRSETHLLLYWTNRFPQLVLQLHNAEYNYRKLKNEQKNRVSKKST